MRVRAPAASAQRAFVVAQPLTLGLQRLQPLQDRPSLVDRHD